MLKPQENVLITLFYVLLRHTLAAAASPSNVTALFVFGDSTVDPGNNIYFPNTAHADHPPYGRDLPHHKPTGRYTNGKLVTDFFASCLGLKEFIPPYLDPNLSDDELISGASFASASMGLDELTCRRADSLSMSKQLDYFDEAANRIRKRLGSEEAARRIANAIFLVSAGSNDVLVNIYDIGTRRGDYDILEYQEFLRQKIKSIIERLYNAGARKIAIAGLPPLGCLPIQVTYNLKVPRSCEDSENEESQNYNSELRNLLVTMRSNDTKDIQLTYLDIYNPIMDMIHRPDVYGFETTLKGCCGTGLFEFGSTCGELSSTCSDASKYLFFDAIHPTEAAYKAISETMCSTSKKMFT